MIVFLGTMRCHCNDSYVMLLCYLESGYKLAVNLWMVAPYHGVQNAPTRHL